MVTDNVTAQQKNCPSSAFQAHRQDLAAGGGQKPKRGAKNQKGGSNFSNTFFVAPFLARKRVRKVIVYYPTPFF